MPDCYDGCKDCDNPVCTEKDVLVLSTYDSDNKVPMIISFDGKNKIKTKFLNIYSGEYREASFEYGTQTEVWDSCSVEFKGEYYVFGGKEEKTQVRGNIKIFRK